MTVQPYICSFKYFMATSQHKRLHLSLDCFFAMYNSYTIEPSPLVVRDIDYYTIAIFGLRYRLQSHRLYLPAIQTIEPSPLVARDDIYYRAIASHWLPTILTIELSPLVACNIDYRAIASHCRPAIKTTMPSPLPAHDIDYRAIAIAGSRYRLQSNRNCCPAIKTIETSPLLVNDIDY